MYCFDPVSANGDTFISQKFRRNVNKLRLTWVFVYSQHSAALSGFVGSLVENRTTISSLSAVLKYYCACLLSCRGKQVSAAYFCAGAFNGDENFFQLASSQLGEKQSG